MSMNLNTYYLYRAMTSRLLVLENLRSFLLFFDSLKLSGSQIPSREDSYIIKRGLGYIQTACHICDSFLNDDKSLKSILWSSRALFCIKSHQIAEANKISSRVQYLSRSSSDKLGESYSLLSLATGLISSERYHASKAQSKRALGLSLNSHETSTDGKAVTLEAGLGAVLACTCIGLSECALKNYNKALWWFSNSVEMAKSFRLKLEFVNVEDFLIAAKTNIEAAQKETENGTTLDTKKPINEDESAEGDDDLVNFSSITIMDGDKEIGKEYTIFAKLLLTTNKVQMHNIFSSSLISNTASESGEQSEDVKLPKKKKLKKKIKVVKTKESSVECPSSPTSRLPNKKGENLTEDIKKISIWLEKIGLQQYFQVLKDAGYDLWNSLSLLTIDDLLTDIGMKHGHAKLFLTSLKSLNDASNSQAGDKRIVASSEPQQGSQISVKTTIEPAILQVNNFTDKKPKLLLSATVGQKVLIRSTF